jgi:hypothetical protein
MGGARLRQRARSQPRIADQVVGLGVVIVVVDDAARRSCCGCGSEVTVKAGV